MSASLNCLNNKIKVKLAEEAVLVRRASQGDSIALVKLYETYIDDIYRYCYSQIGNISDAEALTSETFMRAIEALSHERYTWQGKPFGAWLYGIAIRVLQEHNRQLKRAPMTERLEHLLEYNEPESEQLDILDFIMQQEEQDTLWQLVKELAVEEQQTLVFRHVYEMSYAEIARRLCSSENACKQAHYRVLKKLRLRIRPSNRKLVSVNREHNGYSDYRYPYAGSFHCRSHSRRYTKSSKHFSRMVSKGHTEGISHSESKHSLAEEMYNTDNKRR